MNDFRSNEKKMYLGLYIFGCIFKTILLVFSFVGLLCSIWAIFYYGLATGITEIVKASIENPLNESMLKWGIIRVTLIPFCGYFLVELIVFIGRAFAKTPVDPNKR